MGVCAGRTRAKRPNIYEQERFVLKLKVIKYERTEIFKFKMADRKLCSAVQNLVSRELWIIDRIFCPVLAHYEY